jgi:hypothetical protein
MDHRKAGMAVWVGLCVFSLAAGLGCTSKHRRNQPIIQSFTPAQAAVGSNVILSGYNFSETDIVSFGGEPAAYFHVDSDAQITATVPTTATDGTIAVVSAGGMSSSIDSLLVTPQITGIAPNPATVGSVITLTGNGFFGGASLTFAGAGSTTIPTFPTFNSANQMSVEVPTGAVSGNLELTILGMQCQSPISLTIN